MTDGAATRFRITAFELPGMTIERT